MTGFLSLRDFKKEQGYLKKTKKREKKIIDPLSHIRKKCGIYIRIKLVIIIKLSVTQ